MEPLTQEEQEYLDAHDDSDVFMDDIGKWVVEF
jgi:hypothetical protein